MKANEFVKKYGIAEAKSLVNAQSLTMRQIALSTTVDTKDLTRLVESHDLVESYGGLACCKNHIGYISEEMKQAILDVESRQ